MNNHGVVCLNRKPLAQPQAVPMQSLTILDALRGGMAFEAWNLASIRSTCVVQHGCQHLFGVTNQSWPTRNFKHLNLCPSGSSILHFISARYFVSVTPEEKNLQGSWFSWSKRSQPHPSPTYFLPVTWDVSPWIHKFPFVKSILSGYPTNTAVHTVLCHSKSDPTSLFL